MAFHRCEFRHSNSGGAVVCCYRSAGSTFAEHWPGVLEAVLFGGQTIVGGCVSLTVTVKLQLD